MNPIIADVGVIAGILAVCEILKKILKLRRVWEKVRKYYFFLPIFLAGLVAVFIGSENPLQAAFVWVGAVWAAYNAAKIAEDPPATVPPISPPKHDEQ